MDGNPDDSLLIGQLNREEREDWRQLRVTATQFADGDREVEWISIRGGFAYLRYSDSILTIRKSLAEIGAVTSPIIGSIMGFLLFQRLVFWWLMQYEQRQR